MRAIAAPNLERSGTSITDGTSTSLLKLDGGAGWPRVVVSYQSENVEVLEETRALLTKWGCNPWDGRQGKAGKDWMSQWLAMADSDDTALFVFLISCARVPAICCGAFVWADVNVSELILGGALAGRASLIPEHV